ncbi:predicted protein, partial [Nematostella vectensis]
LILQRELDREVASGYNLTIKALNIHENKFRLAHIRIVVIDENDNAPTFPPSGYHTTIFTNVTEGQEIFRVNAIDVDTGDNANIRYHLLNHQQLFSIMPKTGVLVKTKERFAIDRTRNFTVIVVAINGEFKNVGTVTITVHPVNERRPTFLKRNYEVKVSEAVQVGTSVAKVFAADPDYGNLGKLRYSILTESCPFFGIDDDGVIRNVQPLTRHGGENCTLEITAQDSGIPPLETPRPATVSIVIEPDVNDNRPEFYQYRYSRVFLKEPPLYYAVDTVMAKDADSGQNGRLSYWISGGNEGNFFAIDSRTGVVKTSRMLQRQTLRLFNLTISVADQGSPPMKSEKDALVQVV